MRVDTSIPSCTSHIRREYSYKRRINLLCTHTHIYTHLYQLHHLLTHSQQHREGWGLREERGREMRCRGR